MSEEKRFNYLGVLPRERAPFVMNKGAHLFFVDKGQVFIGTSGSGEPDILRIPKPSCLSARQEALVCKSIFYPSDNTLTAVVVYDGCVCSFSYKIGTDTYDISYAVIQSPLWVCRVLYIPFDMAKYRFFPGLGAFGFFSERFLFVSNDKSGSRVLSFTVRPEGEISGASCVNYVGGFHVLNHLPGIIEAACVIPKIDLPLVGIYPDTEGFEKINIALKSGAEWFILAILYDSLSEQTYYTQVPAEADFVPLNVSPVFSDGRIEMSLGFPPSTAQAVYP